MSTIEKYGKFLTSEGCFEITAEPPRKWRNIHYNQWGGEEYYAEATHIGDGLSRYRDARGNTVNVIGYDAKYLYLRDDETNTVFNPAGMPVATDVADRVIRIFPSQTEIASSCAGLRATQRIFVPRTECLEAWTLKIETRLTGRAVFPFLPTPPLHSRAMTTRDAAFGRTSIRNCTRISVASSSSIAPTKCRWRRKTVFSSR